MCREVAVSELAAPVSGVALFQMWVCDLVMSRPFYIFSRVEVMWMYQALYRKYRPQTFDEVVGQEGVTRTLKTQLVTGHLSHAYLFTGSRGTGKTSCAKILSKAVNCLNPHNGNPCNQCAACRAIDEGSCMDVLEIDAASNNGVDNIRDLRDDAVYSPSEVRHRVYIVDEVHMLSLSAFNALLKIIEEPPEHLIFILATTELHKVPATILSRCQRFSFRRISPEDVADRLQYISSKESITLEPQAAMVLARMADGALRDGVSLLDQCASATQGPVTAEAVYRCLGLAGEQKAALMMSYLADHNTKGALELYDKLYADGKDVAALLDELCALARDLLVLKTAPQSGLSMLSGVATDQEAMTLRDRFSPGELVRIMKELQATAAGFTRGGKTRLDGELCLLRLCQPELNLDAEAMNARLSKLERAVANGIRVVQESPKEPQSEEDRPPMPGDEDAPPPTEEEMSARSAPRQEESPVGFWPDLVSKIHEAIKNPVLRGYFGATPDALVQGSLQADRLELRCSSTYVYELISKRENLELVGQVASEFLGRPIRAWASDQQAKPRSSEHFQELLNFGKQHSNVIKIK